LKKTPASPAPNRFEDLLTRLPLTWIALAFVGGILLASRVTLAWWIWLGAAGAALVLALVLRLLLPRFSIVLPSYFFLLTLSLLGLGLGAARYQASVPTVDAFTLAWYNDREYDLLLTGSVDAPPDMRDTYTNLRVRVTAVDTGKGDLPVSGLALVRVDNGETWRYGDAVRLRGRMTTPPENEEFSYRDYLARQGILSYMSNAAVTRLPFARAGNPLLRMVYDLKDRALANIYAIFPDPEASLMAGILLGEDNGLPADLQQAFKNTGTAHIIAISGFNIAIIAGLFVTLFSRLLGPRRGAVAAVIGIFVYTILVGASASVVRAAIMGTFAIFARQVGRRQTAINTLTATAALMAAVNPYTPWDVGFQLSFFATLGLVLYAGPFQEWAVRIISRFSLPDTAEKIAKPISEYVLFTLAAQLTTLPIMAWHFGRISLVSIIANPFILPAQPLVMILGGLAVLVSFLYLPLGQIFAWIAWPFPAYTVRAVELFDSLPHGIIILGDFSFLFVLLFYAVLFGWTFSQGRVRQTLRAAATPAVIIATLGILAFLTWSAALSAPDGNLHVTFLDVGSADAVLIQTPGGGNILVNGGASPSALSDALGRRIPPFDRHLDWLIVASTQEDQVAALPRTLERVPPGDVLWAGNVEASYSSASLDRWLADRSVPVTRLEPGMALDLGAGARLTVQTVTTRGAILLIEWDGFRLLLPIGQNFDSLDKSDYGAAIGPVTVLLLGDSGLASVNPSKWIANLRPQVVVLSVAAGDLRGRPSEAVLKNIKDATLLRTDRNGWIEVTTDGERMWVDVQKK
jgi:competence protein ComEC